MFIFWYFGGTAIALRSDSFRTAYTYHSELTKLSTQTSVLWRCWLSGKKSIRPVKNWVVGYWRGANLHMAQLMPLPLTVSCFSKNQIGFTFLVLALLGSPSQRAVKQVCVCVCACVCVSTQTYPELYHYLQSQLLFKQLPGPQMVLIKHTILSAPCTTMPFIMPMTNSVKSLTATDIYTNHQFNSHPQANLD